jgi:four helix bundle protein
MAKWRNGEIAKWRKKLLTKGVFLYYFLGIRRIKHKISVMEVYDVKSFNEKMRHRSSLFAVNIYKMLLPVRLNALNSIPIKQLLKSASSVSANFSSATRSRSDAEFYSKICVVTEECDECLHWIDFLTETGIIQLGSVKALRAEAEELLRIFATIKKKLRLKRSP